MRATKSFYLGLSSMLVALLLSIELHGPSSQPNLYSDITQSFWERPWVQAGTLPYLTASFEYPPISGLLLYTTRLVSSTLQDFYATFSILSAIAGVVIVWCCYTIVRKSGKELNSFYFMLPSFIIYGIYNFDLFHAMFVMLSLLALVSRRRTLSAAFLGMAVSTKLVSAVLFPLFLLEVKNEQSGPADGVRSVFSGERLRFIITFVAVILAANLPFAILNFQNFLAGYQFIGNWGLEDAWYVWIFQNPSTWNIAKVFGLGISALLLIRVYTLQGDILAKTFLALVAYLMGTYIYAPQFNLLLLPVIAVIDLDSSYLFLWEGFNALIILTWFIPGSNPTLPGSWPQYFALLRAVCLAMLALTLAAREGYNWRNVPRLLTRSGSGDAATAPVTPPQPPPQQWKA